MAGPKGSIPRDLGAALRELDELLRNPRISVFYIGRTTDIERRRKEHAADFIWILLQGGPEEMRKAEEEILSQAESDPRCVNRALQVGDARQPGESEYLYLAAWA